MFVTRTDKKLSPQMLSSGEKQLLILLSETLLQRQSPAVFIADEPELSLHVKWQEKLVPSLRELNASSQIIAATHSPDIVGPLSDRTIDMEVLLYDDISPQHGGHWEACTRVDKVVYCEGGPPLTVAGILSGGGEDVTLDVCYWTSIAGALGPKKRYHFKSVGSKETLLSIAEDIVASNVITVVVCLDSDFDILLGRGLKHECVVYVWIQLGK